MLDPTNALLQEPAYKSLSDSIKKYPNRDDLYFNRAVLLNKNGYTSAAKADFLKAWSLKKMDVYALGACTSMLVDDPQQTIQFIRNDVAKSGLNNYLIPLTLAKAYAAIQLTDSALLVVQEINKKDSLLPDVLLYEADLYGQKGDTVSMVQALEKVYSQAKTTPYLALKLAYLYAELKNAKSLELSESLLRNDSLKAKAEPYYVMGIYYANTKQHNSALQSFNKVLSIDYYYLNAYVEKIKVYIDLGQMKEAQKEVDLLIQLSPSFADGWYWKGMVQLSLGQKQEAKQSFTKAYVLDKTFIKAKEQAQGIK